MSIAYLALGSNLGDRAAYLEKALKQLEQNGIKIVSRSSVIETEPVGGPPQGKYLNAAVKIETSLEPHELLDLIKHIEKQMGRQKDVRNAARIIDIDILLFDDVTMETKDLTIPHPRMHERDFVIRPLKEIAPEITSDNNRHESHPFAQKTQ